MKFSEVKPQPKQVNESQDIRLLEQQLAMIEKKKMSAKDDPCWDGYHMVGTKTKNGREVPNCVPGKKGVAEGSETDRKHGSPFDRGAADSYYGRPRRPHKGGVGGGSGERIEDLTPEEIEAYHAGYDENERYGDKKQWESVGEGLSDQEINKLRADAEDLLNKNVAKTSYSTAIEPKKSFMAQVGDKQLGMLKGAWKGLTKGVAGVKEDSEPGDVRTKFALQKARQRFPMAKSDAEALALYINSKEQQDVDELGAENDYEDMMIDQLSKFDDRIDQEVDDLQRQIDMLKKHAGIKKESAESMIKHVKDARAFMNSGQPAQEPNRAGYNKINSKEEWLEKVRVMHQVQDDPKLKDDAEAQEAIRQRIGDLNRVGIEQGWAS